MTVCEGSSLQKIERHFCWELGRAASLEELIAHTSLTQELARHLYEVWYGSVYCAGITSERTGRYFHWENYIISASGSVVVLQYFTEK